MSDIWSRLGDGFTDIGKGAGGFIVNVSRAGREIGDGDFGDALAITVGSFQEDLLGDALAGAIGPEGVGGTVIGALPEEVRKPIGTVIHPILGGMDWAIQELVDRPLGTIATVINAEVNGQRSIIDLSTWTRAWNINDQRSFGQSLAAAVYNIDPFSEEEYNSIQDDPMFDLISGTADFVQEFIDPTILIGGGTLKVARGAAVVATKGGTIGRTFSTTGRVSGMGRYLAPRATELRPSTVIGRGTGLRPEKIGGRRIPYMTKTKTQRDRIREIQLTVTAQRARNVAESPYMRQVLGDSVEAAVRAKALERSEYLDRKAEYDAAGRQDQTGLGPEPKEVTANERYKIIKEALGPAGRKMPDEAIRLIANGTTTNQRLNTFRLLAGDMSMLDEAAEAAKMVRDELNQVDVARSLEQGRDVEFELSGAAQDAIDNFDFTLFSAFEDNLLLSQRRRQVPNEISIFETSPSAYKTLNEMPVDMALLGLEQMLGLVDDLIVGSKSAMNLAEVGSPAMNLLSKGVIPKMVKDLPFGRRFQEVARMHRLKAKSDGAAYSEYVNPNTAFGSSRRIRFITERLPHTHIFFTEANAIEQFERVLTQASRVEGGKIIKSAGIDVGAVLGEFTALKIRGDYRGMEDLYNGTIKRINDQIDANYKNGEFGSLQGVDVNHRTVHQMYDEAKKAWQDERVTITGVTNPKGEVETAMQYGDTRRGLPDDPDAEVDSVTRVIRDENAEVIIQQFGVSPSQVQQSAILPRYDIIDLEMRRWADTKTRERARKAEEKARKKGRDVQKAVDKAVVPRLERLSRPMRSPANTAYRYWRQSVLATPKWPMRVQIDEQMRIAANLGALNTVMNFMGGFEKMRRAQAVHKLENWDELKKVERLQEGMRAYAKDNDISVPIDADVLELYELVGKEGFNAGVDKVTKELVLDGKARAKLRRNVYAKTGFVWALMGDPVIGAVYGLVSARSRRRRINDAAQSTAALHYAGALKVEGRRLLAEATTAADIKAARSLMSDAEHIEKLTEYSGSAARASNAFEKAEELLEQAGFAGITIGKTHMRNAFGDDGRYIEQIEASNSANEALSSIYRSAYDTTRRELDQYAPSYEMRDFLERPSDEAWEQGYAAMLNRMTTLDAGKEFYEIVWANSDVATRTALLTELFRNNPKLFTDLVQNSLDLGMNRWLSAEDYEILARQIVEEYENVLPARHFPEARARAAAGEVNWKVTQGDMNRIYEELVDDQGLPPREALYEGGMDGDQVDTFVQTKVVEHIRNSGQDGFGRTFTPRTVGVDEAKNLVDRTFENLFSILAEIPSDQLSRHPYFKSVYERELRRIVEDMADDTGFVSLSQNKINEIEDFARQQALTETRELLYDLRETTRVAEVLTNVSPFFSAWQEVIGRWAGIATDNPTFVAEVVRLYNKEWNAEALGLSQIEDENGNTYLTFRLTGPAYDDEGNETTIFDVMPDWAKNRFIPAPLRSTNNTVRFSKDSLNTVLEGTPGVGPMITMPMREAIVANPQLEDTFSFFFPFGHPEGGLPERLIKANLPAWAKALDDMSRDTQRAQAVQTRMARDLFVEMQASGEFIDWGDEAIWSYVEEESAKRANDWFIFKLGASLFSPASTTMISQYEPLIQEWRAMQQEHGKLVAEDMFLARYGEDFFALSSALTRSNDGMPATVTFEERRLQHQDLINDLGDSGVGAYVVGAVGSDLEQMRFSQTIRNSQLRTPVQPGSKTMQRELYTGRELIENNQERLGWREFSTISDWVKGKQDEAAAAGLSTNLNSKHLRGVSAVKQRAIAEIAERNPTWWKAYQDTGSSAVKRNAINDAFNKVLADPVVSQRDSARHIREYYRVRMWVQETLQARKAAGGSDQLENTRSNADLLAVWEDVRTQMSLNPQFSAVFDRYFARDMISSDTFIDPSEWPEGFWNV
jgi:hypothetical protein